MKDVAICSDRYHVVSEGKTVIIVVSVVMHCIVEKLCICEAMSKLLFYDLDCRFLEKSVRIVVSIWWPLNMRRNQTNVCALYRRGPLASMAMCVIQLMCSLID